VALFREWDSLKNPRTVRRDSIEESAIHFRQMLRGNLGNLSLGGSVNGFQLTDEGATKGVSLWHSVLERDGEST